MYFLNWSTSLLFSACLRVLQQNILPQWCWLQGCMSHSFFFPPFWYNGTCITTSFPKVPLYNIQGHPRDPSTRGCECGWSGPQRRWQIRGGGARAMTFLAEKVKGEGSEWVSDEFAWSCGLLSLAPVALSEKRPQWLRGGKGKWNRQTKRGKGKWLLLSTAGLKRINRRPLGPPPPLALEDSLGRRA